MRNKLLAVLIIPALLFTYLPLYNVNAAGVSGGSGGIPINAKTDRNKTIVTLSKSGGVANCPVFT